MRVMGEGVMGKAFAAMVAGVVWLGVWRGGGAAEGQDAVDGAPNSLVLGERVRELR